MKTSSASAPKGKSLLLKILSSEWFERIHHFFIWKLLFGCRLIGREKIPEGVTVIFAGNHVSHYDMFFLVTVFKLVSGKTRKRVIPVAWEGIKSYPILGTLYDYYNCISVSDKKQVNALKKMIRVLKSGHDIHLQCEGGVNPVLGPFQNGAAIASLKSGSPIFPFSLCGAHDLFPNMMWPDRYWGNVSIVLHDPIYPQEYLERYDDLRTAAEYMTSDLRAAVASGIDYPDGEATGKP